MQFDEHMPGDPAGQVIAGCYEIVRPLGTGGMGKVFLVVDRTDGRQYAMKILRGQWQENERVIARFAREVRALRQLNHPCIVKVFDARRDKDVLYFTMEYIEGKTVRQWLRARKQLEFGSVVRVLCLVAKALEYAHTITIHRDISPDNIMVQKDGSVRLLDFGLAKLEDANQGLTMVGASMGKMQYNAPEQRRNAADVDHRADIYSLGICFFEMLTGKRPKPGRELLEMRPDLPRQVLDFYRKATAEDRDARFQSAQEFREALMALYQGEQRKCQPPPGRAEHSRLRRLFTTLNPARFLRRRKPVGREQGPRPGV